MLGHGQGAGSEEGLTNGGHRSGVLLIDALLRFMIFSVVVHVEDDFLTGLAAAESAVVAAGDLAGVYGGHVWRQLLEVLLIDRGRAVRLWMMVGHHLLGRALVFEVHLGRRVVCYCAVGGGYRGQINF